MKSINNIEISSYSDLIRSTHKSLSILNSAGIIIPPDSWIFEALSHAKLSEYNLRKGTLEQFTSEGAIRWKTTVAFGNISEFNFIVSQLEKLLKSNNKVVKKKIKDIIKMPLMVKDEDSSIGTNRGRNTLFELRLATRLMKSGFGANLTFDHPDILVPTIGHEYAIECKRIFSINSFEKLTLEAISQLIDYSLTGNSNRLGIVAISITRGFHKGDMKLNAESHEELEKLVDREIGKLVKTYSDFIQKSFPKNIPAIIIDYSDFAEGERPYWIHWLWVVGTGNGLGEDLIHNVTEDLSNFLSEN